MARLMDALDGLARVAAQDVLEQVTHAQDLAGGELHIGRLAHGAAVGLMQEDAGMGQSEALALCAGGQ